MKTKTSQPIQELNILLPSYTLTISQPYETLIPSVQTSTAFENKY